MKTRIPRTTVKIAGRTLQVPTYRDAKCTLRLADSISARIRAIEAESDRIDTPAFALEAAFAFAAEAQTHADSAEAERLEMLKELDRLHKFIEKLVREFKLKG